MREYYAPQMTALLTEIIPTCLASNCLQDAYVLIISKLIVTGNFCDHFMRVCPIYKSIILLCARCVMKFFTEKKSKTVEKVETQKRSRE